MLTRLIASPHHPSLAAAEGDPQRLIIIGQMGSGKTSVSQVLADRLGYTLVDTDQLIVRRTRLSIEEIFETLGEEHFRHLEAGLVHELMDKKESMVISAGGGTPCFHDNMAALKSGGETIFLQCDPEILAQRLERDQEDTTKPKRPLLKKKTGDALVTFLSEQLAKRKGDYEKADIIVAINGKRTVQSIVDEILSQVSK